MIKLFALMVLLCGFPLVVTVPPTQQPSVVAEAKTKTIPEVKEISQRERILDLASRGSIRSMDVKVTAYTEAEDECGKSPSHPAYGITASGEKVRRGIIAADTRVIPMHSEVYIDGLGEYDGIYYVKDTGGAINGNRIDIYVPTKNEAFKIGRKSAKMYIIHEGSR